MATTFLLIRHAAHAHLGHILTGRMEGVELSETGREQAEQLAMRLLDEPLAAIQSSPSLRTIQTARAIVRPRELEVDMEDQLAEVDFGEWTGRSFAELDVDPSWRHWNSRRGSAQAPGGETMAAVQRRAWDHLVRMAQRFSDAVVAIVSHCDVIRAVIARALGLPLDNLLRFDVDPASVSRIVVGDWGARVVSVNERMA